MDDNFPSYDDSPERQLAKQRAVTPEAARPAADAFAEPATELGREEHIAHATAELAELPPIEELGEDGDGEDNVDTGPFFAPIAGRAETTAVVDGGRHINGEVFAPDANVERIIMPEGIDRAGATALLNQRQKTNEFGLPIAFVRSDMLPSDLGNLTYADMDAATVGLFYHEGYPTLENGVAFWSQLPHETRQAHELFMDFVRQAEELGVRQLDVLAQTTSQTLDYLNSLYREFFWSVRARAYDMFVVVAEQKKRHARIRSTENKHFLRAGELFDKLIERFEDEEWIEELSAKEAVEILETLVRIQRLSLGLVGQKASSTPLDALPDGASTEAIMRNVARNAGLSTQGTDDFAARLQQLTSDPANGMVIQEAILKLGRAPSGQGSEGAGMGDGLG